MATNTEKIVVQVIVKGEKELNRVGKSADKSTKSFGKMAAGVLAAAAAFKQIGQVVSSVIKSWKAFEFQMAKVKAITGANETQFKMLTKSAQQLGRTTFFTAKQVAELQTNYGKLGFTTGEILKAQEATLALATATDSDLARAAIVAGAAVRGFGLDASETRRVTDVMAVSFTSSAMDMEKWQTSMTKVAPIAAAAGISIESTAAVMSKLTDTGIEASIAGTSLRNILLKMQDSSSDLAKHLGFTVNSSEDLQKALSQLNSEGLSNEEIMGLVDLRQVAAFNTMIRGAESVAELTDKFNNANGALTDMVNIIEDNLEGDTKKLTSALDGLQQEVGEKLSPNLRKTAQNLTEVTNEATDNADAIAELITKVTNFGLTLVNNLTPLLLYKRGLEKIMNVFGMDGWRTFSDLVGLTTPKDSGGEAAAKRTERLNKSLQTTLDLTDANVKQTKDNIAATETQIRIREKELENLKALEQSGSMFIVQTGERARVVNELTLLEEKLKSSKLSLAVFEQKQVASGKKSTEAEVEKIEVKKKLTAAQEIESEALRDYVDIMALVLNGTMTQKEAEEALRFERIKATEDMLASLPEFIMDAELRIKLEKQLIDLKLKGISDEKTARQEQIDGVAKLGDQLINLAGEDEKMQGIKKAGIALSSAAAIANNIQALSEAALGVSSQAKLPFPANIIGMVTTLGTVVSLLANIKAMKGAFGDGGMIEAFANGGMVNGKSHAQGGEKFAVGGRVVELEGGEAVINKRSTAMFRNQLSAMNSVGGGVKFADGGLLNMPSFSQQQFNALGQNQMMGAMGSGGKVVVVEADITDSQNSVSVIQSEATI